jgi:hypothetical protein
MANGNLTGDAMAAVVVAARARIVAACAERGPFVFQVSRDALTRVL